MKTRGFSEFIKWLSVWNIVFYSAFFISCNAEMEEVKDIEASVQLQQVQTWEIGSAEIIPNPFFFGVLNDESLVIIDRSLHTINHFDSAGNLIESFGGRGRGPGEYANVTHAAIHPNGNVAIADITNARFTVINIFDGTMVTEELDAGWNTRISWVSERLVITNYPFRIGMTHPGDVLMRVYDPATQTKELFMHLELEMTNPPYEQISCTFCDFRFLEDLSFYTTPQDTSYRIFFVNPHTEEELLFSRSGISAVELTEAEREQRREQVMGASRMAGIATEDYEPPTHKNRFMNFFPDHKKRLWALMNTPDGEQNRFDLFSFQGDYIGSLNAPEEFRSVEFIWGDRILFQYHSEDPDEWKAGLYRIID